MNRVGEAGKGESIWLGWFLYTTLLAFAPLADIRREGRARFDVAASRRLRLRDRWSAKDGTATGIGADTSMTARRSARPAISNAESIRSRSRGA